LCERGWASTLRHLAPSLFQREGRGGILAPLSLWERERTQRTANFENPPALRATPFGKGGEHQCCDILLPPFSKGRVGEGFLLPSPFVGEGKNKQRTASFENPPALRATPFEKGCEERI